MRTIGVVYTESKKPVEKPAEKSEGKATENKPVKKPTGK